MLVHLNVPWCRSRRAFFYGHRAVLTGLFLLVTGDAALAVTTTWMGGAGNINWSNPANWSAGLPGPGTDTLFVTNGAVATPASNNIVASNLVIGSLTYAPTNATSGSQNFQNTFINGGGPNIGYTLKAASSPATPANSWTTVATNAFDASGNFTNVDAGSVSQPNRFYRISVP